VAKHSFARPWGERESDRGRRPGWRRAYRRIQGGRDSIQNHGDAYAKPVTAAGPRERAIPIVSSSDGGGAAAFRAV
jgi:hypothetical protein